MARINISGPTTKILSATLGGSPVAALKDWFDFAKGQGSVIARTINGVSYLEVDDDTVTMSPLLLALANGFTVEGAPVYIKMNTTRYATGVPEGISNRSYVTGEGEEAQTVIRTWADWHDATHTHMTAADGDKIVPGNSFGSELTSSELSILLAAEYSMRLGHELGDWLPAASE